MHPTRLLPALACLASALVAAEVPQLPGIGAAMQDMIAKKEITGAVTIVVSKDKILHLESTGLADVAEKNTSNIDSQVELTGSDYDYIDADVRNFLAAGRGDLLND